MLLVFKQQALYTISSANKHIRVKRLPSAISGYKSNIKDQSTKFNIND